MKNKKKKKRKEKKKRYRTAMFTTFFTTNSKLQVVIDGNKIISVMSSNQNL